MSRRNFRITDIARRFVEQRSTFADMLSHSRQRTRKQPTFKNLLRDERGAILLIVTVYLPVIVGFFTLAVDFSYVLRTRNMLQVTAEAAALAASAQLPDPTNSCSTAKTYATLNMPIASYGNVLKQNSTNCSDIVLGSWSATCVAGQNCFVRDPTQTCTGSVQCNAVQVTTRTAAANGNALQLAFAPLVGFPTFNISATAIAIYGGPGAQAWNIMVAQDISQSFTSSSSCPNCLANAKAADLALLNCVNQNAGSGSKFGVNLLTGTSTTGAAYQVATTSTNDTTLKNAINAINGCGTSGMPACSGTNFSPALTSATTTICPSGSCTSVPSGPRNAVVFVTDGVPNCVGMSGGDTACKNAAITAVNTAATDGIDVFVIYYGTNSSDAAWLQTLPRGHGIYLNAPTPGQIVTSMQAICATMPHRLAW